MIRPLHPPTFGEMLRASSMYQRALLHVGLLSGRQGLAQDLMSSAPSPVAHMGTL